MLRTVGGGNAAVGEPVEFFRGWKGVKTIHGGRRHFWFLRWRKVWDIREEDYDTNVGEREENICCVASN